MRTPHGLKEAIALVDRIIVAELNIRRIDGEYAADIEKLHDLLNSTEARRRQEIEPQETFIAEAKLAIKLWYPRNLHRYGKPGTRMIDLDIATLKANLGGSWKIQITGETDAVLDQIAKLAPDCVETKEVRTLDSKKVAEHWRKLRNIEGLELSRTDMLLIESRLLKGKLPDRLKVVYAILVNPKRDPKGATSRRQL